jgi:hypothetical protein
MMRLSPAIPNAPTPNLTYRDRLVAAAGKGFVSIPRRSAKRRVIEGILARGFRRPEIADGGDGTINILAWYGEYRVTRIFALNHDGSWPDHVILAGMSKIADRMDAKRLGGRRKTRQRAPATVLGHPIYVYHGNEQPKLEELVAALPPAGGMTAYVAEMGIENDRQLLDRAA